MKYDYLVVGAELYGASFTRLARLRGVLVINKRSAVDGNGFSEENSKDIKHNAIFRAYSSEWRQLE